MVSVYDWTSGMGVFRTCGRIVVHHWAKGSRLEENFWASFLVSLRKTFLVTDEGWKGVSGVWIIQEVGWWSVEVLVAWMCVKG